MFRGIGLSLSYFDQFGSTCYILKNKLYLKKFDVKAQKGVFLGYSECSKAYTVYNSQTNMVKELIHIKFDNKEPGSKMSELVQKFSEICVSEDTSGARDPKAGCSEMKNTLEAGCSEAIRTSEASDPTISYLRSLYR